MRQILPTALCAPLLLAACTTTPTPEASRLQPGQVAAGNHHSLWLREGRVYAAGEDRFGQLGQGQAGAISNPDPVQVGGLPRVSQVYAASGGNHNLALTGAGEAYGWGWNNLGQVGTGQKGTDVYTPQRLNVPPLTGAALGTGHTLAVGADGQLYGWGRNTLGQLGTGDTAERLAPAPLGLSGVAEVASGINHGVALTRQGEVYTWGGNNYGQIGNGTRTTGVAGAVLSPSRVSLPARARAIAAGNYNTFAILETGELYAWGDNTGGVLGDGSAEARSTPVLVPAVRNAALLDSGARHTLALMADGTVLAWGDGEVGQLGDGQPGSATLTPIPVTLPGRATGLSIGTNHNLLRLEDGRTLGFGTNGSGRLAQSLETGVVAAPTELLAP